MDQHSKDARQSDMEVTWAVTLLDGWLLSGSRKQRFHNIREVYYSCPCTEQTCMQKM